MTHFKRKRPRRILAKGNSSPKRMGNASEPPPRDERQLEPARDATTNKAKTKGRKRFGIETEWRWSANAQRSYKYNKWFRTAAARDQALATLRRESERLFHSTYKPVDR